MLAEFVLLSLIGLVLLVLLPFVAFFVAKMARYGYLIADHKFKQYRPTTNHPSPKKEKGCYSYGEDLSEEA